MLVFLLNSITKAQSVVTSYQRPLTISTCTMIGAFPLEDSFFYRRKQLPTHVDLINNKKLLIS